MTWFRDPWTRGLFHMKRTLGVSQCFQWSPDFQAGRLNLVVEGENSLDQSGCSSCCFGVTDL